jgi:hypothetical protein
VVVVVVVIVMVVEVSSGKVVELCGGEGPGGQHERGAAREETKRGLARPIRRGQALSW